MTTCVLVASSGAEVLTMAAAVRSGALGAGSRRVLVLAGDDRPASLMEVAERLSFADEVVGPDRLLDVTTGPDDAVTALAVGSRTLEVGRSLARRLESVPVTLVAAGADAYGPTPEEVRGRLARLTERVLHLDLLPGVAPLLLAERQVPATPVPVTAYREVAGSLPAPGAVVDPTTLVLGRTEVWTPALEPDDQTELLVAMVQRAAEAGHSRIVLLLDPGVRPRTRKQLEKAAAGARADLTLLEDDGPAERWFADPAVRLVIGCGSEDLLVAATVFGRRTAQLDSDVLLKRLDPFSDRRRTAATLVGATVPDLRSWTAAPEGEAPPPVDLPGLLTTVAYVMRPELVPERRRAALAFLAATDQGRRYVRRRRLSELRLPGGKRKVRKVLD